jgi:hypothetical protein
VRPSGASKPDRIGKSRHRLPRPAVHNTASDDALSRKRAGALVTTLARQQIARDKSKQAAAAVAKPLPAS